MKICQLCAVDFTLKVFLLPLIDYQVKSGAEVISVCSDGNYVKSLRKEGYKIHTISISRSFNLIRHIYSIYHLVKFFKKEKFDIVHVHTPVASIVGRIAAKISDIPFVVYTAHGFYFHDEMNSKKKAFFIFLERFAGYFTDLIFTQSSEDALFAKQKSILPKEKIFAIGNGVDPKKFNPDNFITQASLREELGIKKNTFLVGMIARLVKEKGILEFIEAAIKLSNSHENITFILIGNRLDTDHNNDVNKKLTYAKSILKSKLLITGMRSDIPELLSLMNAFVLPSWREGMPRTIIEAMMMGLPVVASNIRGCREEVVNGVTGILVPVRDSNALFLAIETLFLDNKLCLKMGLAGRRRALDLYDENNIVKLQDEIIKHHFNFDYLDRNNNF